MYTFKITYIFIIYNLNTFFPYISISVHSTLFKFFFFLYWCYIASPLCYSYVCLYYRACLHYVNKKWSDKDTDCTCCVYCILKWSWNHKNRSFPWIYDMFNFFFLSFCFWWLHPDTTRPPLGDAGFLILTNRQTPAKLLVEPSLQVLWVWAFTSLHSKCVMRIVYNSVVNKGEALRYLGSFLPK